MAYDILGLVWLGYFGDILGLVWLGYFGTSSAIKYHGLGYFGTSMVQGYKRR
jgi:hypothetical protein